MAEKTQEHQVKYLEMIQGVINRMAQNSFLIKGWSVTLAAALFALAAKDSNPYFALVVFAPILVFWGLDGYFLYQERLYRGLFKAAAGQFRGETAETVWQGVKNPPDLPRVFDLNAKGYKGLPGVWSWWRATFWGTVPVFYLAVTIVTIAVVSLLFYKGVTVSPSHAPSP